MASENTKKYLLQVCVDDGLVRTYVADQKGRLVNHGEQIFTAKQAADAAYKTYDPMEIIYAMRSAILQALQTKAFAPQLLAGLGIINKTSLALAWHAKTGMPLSPVLGDYIKVSKNSFFTSPRIGAMTSSSADDWLGKLQHLGQFFPEAKKALKNHTACWGGVESWLLYNLTGKQSWATDLSHAVRSGLFVAEQSVWRENQTRDQYVTAAVLPQVLASVAPFGVTHGFVPLPDGLPITSITEDGVAALMGIPNLRFGVASLSFRPGYLAFYTGKDQPSLTRELQTRFLASGDDVRYAAEWPCEFPLYLLDFLAKIGLQLDQPELAQTLAAISAEEGLVIAPDFFGGRKESGLNLGLFGFNASTTPLMILKALYECWAFQTKYRAETAEEKYAYHIKELYLNDDFTHNAYLMQFLADVLQIPVFCYLHATLSLYGALNLTAKGCAWERGLLQPGKKEIICYAPILDPLSSLALYNRWKEALATNG